jgi:hypothetical protein
MNERQTKRERERQTVRRRVEGWAHSSCNSAFHNVYRLELLPFFSFLFVVVEMRERAREMCWLFAYVCDNDRFYFEQWRMKRAKLINRLLITV